MGGRAFAWARTMNKLQLPILVLGGIIVLSAGTCSNKDPDKQHAMSGFAEGKWVLENLNGQEVQVPKGTETPYIATDSTGESISGFAGCNRLSGGVKIAGDSISFPGLLSTRMYCVETQMLENSFLDALRATRTFTVKGDVLTLSSGKELAVLRHRK
jgi:heat shock protein HslJ